MNLRIAFIATLGFSTLVSVAKVDTADAGRGRFGGGGRISVRGSSGGASFRAPRGGFYGGRSYARPTRGWSVGGRVYAGRGFRDYRGYRPYAGRYYRPYVYGGAWGVGMYNPWFYQPVPSYYGYGYAYQNDYYPVAPATAAPSAVVVAAPTRPPLPKFGVGVFAGGVSVEDQNESSDLGLLGRFRLTEGLLVEGELGQTSYQDNLRLDRRLGASLVYEIGAYNKLAPYVLAGLGVQQAEVNSAYNTTQNFAELGVGLRYALSPGLHLLFDVRAGSRATVSEDAPATMGGFGTSARVVTPPSIDSGESEEYTRARLSAVLYF